MKPRVRSHVWHICNLLDAKLTAFTVSLLFFFHFFYLFHSCSFRLSSAIFIRSLMFAISLAATDQNANEKWIALRKVLCVCVCVCRHLIDLGSNSIITKGITLMKHRICGQFNSQFQCIYEQMIENNRIPRLFASISAQTRHNEKHDERTKLIKYSLILRKGEKKNNNQKCFFFYSRSFECFLFPTSLSLLSKWSETWVIHWIKFISQTIKTTYYINKNSTSFFFFVIAVYRYAAFVVVVVIIVRQRETNTICQI